MNQSHAQSAKLSKLMPAYLVPGLYVISGEGYSVLSKKKGGILEGIGTIGYPSLDFLKKKGETGAFKNSFMPHMDGFEVLLADKPCWDLIVPKAAAELGSLLTLGPVLHLLFVGLTWWPPPCHGCTKQAQMCLIIPGKGVPRMAN